MVKHLIRLGKMYLQEGLPFTEFDVSVDMPIYNAKKGEKFGIIMTGQETATDIVEIEDDPLMLQGEKALVFCKRNTDGTYRILGGPQGRLAYQDGKLTSVELLKTKGRGETADRIREVEVGKVVKQIEASVSKQENK